MIRFLAFVSLLLALVAAAAFFLLENPDRFKDQILQGVESATGYEITVDGELSWRYWPPIAINAELIQLGIPGEPPFIKLDRVSIDIDLMPLITQQRSVVINEISVNGGKISLQVDKNGKGNWELSDTSSPRPSPDAAGSADIAQTSTLQRFLAEDITISYVDAQARMDYGIALTKLSTSAITSDRSFDISLNAKIQDNIENVQALIKSTKLRYSSSTINLASMSLLQR
ncbi:MAG: AsmA family protein [Candidatus Azotimanducaceae bacterium WSBS_2022_MAG_OTU7]